jgi:MOSC domain-containing protein YiiM
MPALKPTVYYARVTWLGVVPAESGLRAVPCDTLVVDFDGPTGESHSGRTRRSCSRVSAQHANGTDIANVRQMSILSAEEMALIETKMGIEALDPGWLGATMVIEGIPDFSHVPPSSRLQGPDGVTIVIDMENRPCHLPGREIDKAREGFGSRFKVAAQMRRGVTAWIERPGQLSVGDKLRLHIPDQPVWSHLDAARQ